MNAIIFITGPTATGKTELACDIARRSGAEIVSCDSMLVYKEANILTSKPPSNILREIKHHFVNVVSVEQAYDVFQYYKQAAALIDDLAAKNKPVIVCGGTGLYMKALLDGILEGPCKNDALRLELKKEAEINGRQYLYQKLKDVDGEAAKKISPNDMHRVMRALEVYYTTGIPMSKIQKRTEGLYGKYPTYIIGLHADRKYLYERINNRVDKMVSDGAFEEVNELLKFSLSATAEKIIGIKEIKQFVDGKLNKKAAVEMIKKNTRNFAKRQVTWFKREKRISWINIQDHSVKYMAERVIEAGYLKRAEDIS